MTKKLENTVIWEKFGYGMIAKKLANDPKTEEMPVIMFVHKDAAAGKYHNGEKILDDKRERAMEKEVDKLVELLNKFAHHEDFVDVGKNYNQPNKPRKPRSKAAKNPDGEIIPHDKVPKRLKDVSPNGNINSDTAMKQLGNGNITEPPKKRGRPKKSAVAA